MVDFGLCMIIGYGDQLKDFVPKLKKIVDGLDFHHGLFCYSEKYMKNHSTLVYFEDAFFDYEKSFLFEKKIIIEDLPKHRESVCTSTPLLPKNVYSAVI
jgi:hypothetical protein